MKQFILLSVTILVQVCALGQMLRTGTGVEVDISLADSTNQNWKKGTVTGYNATTKTYEVKILDGDKINIPSRQPEKWIRPIIDKNLMIKYGPGSKIPFQSREKMLQAVDCRPTEKFIKKNIRSLMAAEYKDFDFMYVDFPKYKPQHGYDDPKNEGQFIYPFELEWFVHLKRTVIMGGKVYVEYQTWEYDREYAYATRGKKKCEFYPLEHDAPELVSSGWFEEGR